MRAACCTEQAMTLPSSETNDLTLSSPVTGRPARLGAPWRPSQTGIDRLPRWSAGRLRPWCANGVGTTRQTNVGSGAPSTRRRGESGPNLTSLDPRRCSRRHHPETRRNHWYTRLQPALCSRGGLVAMWCPGGCHVVAAWSQLVAAGLQVVIGGLGGFSDVVLRIDAPDDEAEQRIEPAKPLDMRRQARWFASARPLPSVCNRALPLKHLAGRSTTPLPASTPALTSWRADSTGGRRVIRRTAAQRRSRGPRLDARRPGGARPAKEGGAAPREARRSRVPSQRRSISRLEGPRLGNNLSFLGSAGRPADARGARLDVGPLERTCCPWRPNRGGARALQ